ncbi:MAG: hypothetical protein BGO37_06880 [Cellulomonas sp. 73-92]|uniref:hypothetical protein n=1 Tax=Cellulomonas sp. 73-92 TaxID=1895740 RepID=UPI00092B7356|nr:hypothetical protein [Cellulomonas sp. 73-92]OJV75955.1 MAG: hypothetical protein BGO37_06880 [Cellulomonas sp. 73-92]
MSQQTPHPTRTAEPAPRTGNPTGGEHAATLATHRDPSLHRDRGPHERNTTGVQWVQPTDLAARAGGALLQQGIQANRTTRALLAAAAHGGQARLRAALARRQTQLDPDESPNPASRPAAGRRAVSR